MIDIGVNFAHKYSSDKILHLLEHFRRHNGHGVISISNSVKEMVINKKLSEKSLHLSTTAPFFPVPIYYTAGCHPHGASGMNEAGFKKIISCVAENSNFASNISGQNITRGCVAIGEMGLDYNRMFSPKDVQITVFRRQIQLAKSYQMPMYLHVRDAFDDFVRIIREENYTHGVVHCFTGNLEQAEILVNMGFKLGITGWLLDTRRNADLIRVIESPTIPIESIMVETDAPFMNIFKYKKEFSSVPGVAHSTSSSTDVSSTGDALPTDLGSSAGTHPKKLTKKNQKESEPTDVNFILYEICRLKGLDLKECSDIVLNTTKTLFRI